MKMTRFAIVGLASCLALSQSPNAFSDADFWQSPYSESASNSASSVADANNQLNAQLAISDQVDFEGRIQRHQSFSATQSLNASSAISMGYSSTIDNSNWVLGYTHKNLTVSMLRGKGDGYARLAGQYQGLDPYLFHPGTGQKFEAVGFALDYGVGRFGHIQYGASTVKADFLKDRKAQYLEWSNNRYFAKASRFQLDGESIGNGLDLGFAFSNKRVALQTMSLDNHRRMQRIRFEFDGNKGRQYWLDLSSHQNPLFESDNDYQIMFNFRTPLGANNLVSYQNGGGNGAGLPSGEQDPNANKKKKGWSRPVLIGAGVAAAALLASSGSSSNDSVTRFSSQNEAARAILNEVNPPSVRENREYGGWIFLTQSGEFGASNAAIGGPSSVTLPDPRTSVPEFSRITASYHTHAAFDPRFDNENFSPTDLENDRRNNIDGYLATPLGQFKLHDIETDTVITLGTVAN